MFTKQWRFHTEIVNALARCAKLSLWHECSAPELRLLERLQRQLHQTMLAIEIKEVSRNLPVRTIFEIAVILVVCAALFGLRAETLAATLILYFVGVDSEIAFYKRGVLGKLPVGTAVWFARILVLIILVTLEALRLTFFWAIT